MATNPIHPGFMGLATLTPKDTGHSFKIRCTDFGVNLEQDVQFYDHSIGLLDTIETPGTTPVTKGEQTDSIVLNKQKTFWRPGVKIIRGSLNFPVDLNAFSALFDLAKFGKWFSLDFAYNCKFRRSYEECRVNSMTVSITAGDILTMSMDVIGRIYSETPNEETYKDTVKLVTWDKVNVSTTSTFSSSAVYSFEMTVNNNCLPIYTSGYNTSGSLFPKDIRVGMQEVTGVVTFYERGTAGNPLGSTTKVDTISLKIGDWSKDLTVIYKPIQRSSSVTVPLHTLGFIGVDNPLGT